MISTSPLVGVVKPVIIDTALLFPAGTVAISKAVWLLCFQLAFKVNEAQFRRPVKDKGPTGTVVAKKSRNARVHCEAHVLHSHLLTIDLQASGDMISTKIWSTTDKVCKCISSASNELHQGTG